ncbi:fimbrial protein [Mixta theicola]|uniref:Fimbrial protein n=1 Tax=Mixta theicola TaxID=1458355 RepID=A0A2K1Q8A4_9GAMM|nr:fimbria/pilus outer membrane usher protein [Mixta theicola]PNS11256.1 fimbrial protein [Mixta theicola]GLR07474.1 outer membrane usher protein [Mixta theicola]
MLTFSFYHGYSRYKKNSVFSSAFIAVIGCTLHAPAVAEVSFDPIFLNQAAGDHIDITRFNGEFKIPPGIYASDIYLNNQLLGRENVIVRDKKGESVICFNQTLVNLTGFRINLLSSAQQNTLRQNNNCTALETLQPSSRARMTLADMRLNLQIPQAWLSRVARGYVDPELWEDGSNALYASYDNSYFKQESGRFDSESFYSKLGGSINIHGWMFRHSGAWRWNKNNGSSYSVFSNNLQRDITPLRSRILIGDANSSGTMFNSFMFRGVRLATSDQMLPDSQRGYAPVVRGIAQTNARVRIRQNNALIYETTVPPGEFAINDIYPSGYGGDLSVTVTESDGRETEFIVPYASVSEMIRPGSYRYSLLLGTLRNQNVSYTPKVFQATVQYGVNNWLTGYSGLLGSGDYLAGLVGGAVGTSIGAFALDATSSRFDDGISAQSGVSVRASYSKFISATNSSVSIAAYRFSSSGYLDLTSATQLVDIHQKADRIGGSQLNRPHNRLSLTLNQRLGESSGNIYTSGYVENYWDRQGSDVQYQLGYTNRFRLVNYGISINRAKTATYSETQYLLSFSLPLGRGSHTPYVNSYTTRSDEGVSTQLALSGVLGEKDQVDYNVGVTREDNGDSSGNISGSYRFKNTQLKASYARSKNYRSYTAGMNGSFVMLPDALIASPYNGDTLAVVQAKGAAGATIEGYPGVIINDAGYALVPYLTPYRINKIAINPIGMPLDVELESTVKQVVPRAGAIVKVNYPTRQGNALLIQARLPDGEALPFGASVKTEDGHDVGVVAQGGKMYIRLEESMKRLQVSWGPHSRYTCLFDVNLPEKTNKRQRRFQRFNTTCHYPTPTVRQEALAKSAQ